MPGPRVVKPSLVMLLASLHVSVYPLSDLLAARLEFLGGDYPPSLPIAVVAVGSPLLASSLYVVGFHYCIIKITIYKSFDGMVGPVPQESTN